MHMRLQSAGLFLMAAQVLQYWSKEGQDLQRCIQTGDSRLQASVSSIDFSARSPQQNAVDFFVTTGWIWQTPISQLYICTLSRL